MKKRIKGYAIVWKEENPDVIVTPILEAYDDFEMLDVFESLKGARLYLKKYFTKKNWPNYQRDIKVVPCEITFNLPKK